MTAIKNKCLDCCCGQTSEIRECTLVKCPLHPFRLGKDPFRNQSEAEEVSQSEISEEQKAIYAERMKNYWKNKKEK